MDDEPIDIEGCRIFILGAGFSSLAGLPLARDLFTEVKTNVERRFGLQTKFHRDLRIYVHYRLKCGTTGFTEADVDLEEFMSFLDIEHYLGLRGGDTWSRDGNESQLMIRAAIGEVLHRRTPPADKLPDAYYRFAEQLEPDDTVITLNYDVILERALEHVSKPFRLFPYRLKQLGWSSDVVDDSIREVAVLKLHGSVDWFDDRGFLELIEARGQVAAELPPRHPIFADKKHYDARPLLEGLHHDTDPLTHIYRIRKVDEYYQADHGLNAPFILSPSHVKFVYVEPLLGFWRGLGQAGGWNLGVSVIGFSLPEHDEHMKMVIYKIISNYQNYAWDDKLLGPLKDAVRFVDFQKNPEGIAAFKKRYGFTDPKKTEHHFDGFDLKAVDFLFKQFRHPSG